MSPAAERGGEALSLGLHSPVEGVAGIGPRRAAMLAGQGIETVGDLLRYQPFRYQDRSRPVPIPRLVPGKEAVLEVEVSSLRAYTASGRMRIVELGVRDPSGRLTVRFFNQPYLKRAFRKGDRVVFCGVPSREEPGGRTVLLNPDYELFPGDGEERLHSGRIVPVYRRIEGLTTRILRRLIHGVLEQVSPGIQDPLPAAVLQRNGFPGLGQALRDLHFPCPAQGESREGLLEDLGAKRSAAHRRLIFEEFFLFQWGLQLVRRRRQGPARQSIVSGEAIARLGTLLPYRLTAAQQKASGEIAEDLAKNRPMNRLLQGDVGAGKTAVALLGALLVMENGRQVALMAPTELLAEQHYRTMRPLLEGAGRQAVLLTGSVRGAAREDRLRGVREGDFDLVIGTHSLIQKGVRFRDLALAIIDEQHRFGVSQRSGLMRKADSPHLLVMSATPIPRSLALTLYGDLDVSTVDQMPPGRAPVRTVLRYECQRQQVYQEIREAVEAGRQAFVVYPAIESKEKRSLPAAREMAARLGRSVFPEFRVGLMHGRLERKQRDELMEGFRRGEVDLLVSTTVIEVGIDIPNSSLLVVEQAERFGLSQLHQLRGRIVRGPHPGLCILMTDSEASSNRRLEILVKTRDGFEVAEKDLEMRGPGEFLGTRQSGDSGFLFADLVRDRQVLELARNEVIRLLEGGQGPEVWPPIRPKGDFLGWWRKRFDFLVG